MSTRNWMDDYIAPGEADAVRANHAAQERAGRCDAGNHIDGEEATEAIASAGKACG